MKPPKWFLRELKLISPDLSVRFVPCQGRPWNGALIHGPWVDERGDTWDNPLDSKHPYCEQEILSRRYLCGFEALPHYKYGRWIIERELPLFIYWDDERPPVTKKVEAIVCSDDGHFEDLSSKTLRELQELNPGGFGRSHAEVKKINKELYQMARESAKRAEDGKLRDFHEIMDYQTEDIRRHVFNPILRFDPIKRIFPGTILPKG